jgi:hypothetical protein
LHYPWRKGWGRLPVQFPSPSAEKVQVLGLSRKSVPSASRISFINVLSSPMARQNQLKIHLIRHEITPHSDPSGPSAPPHKPNSRDTNLELLLTNHCISNRQPPRLEPIATHRKQTIAAKSNRQLLPVFNPAPLQPLAPSFQPPYSNRQLETIRNGRNPFEIKHMNFSNRPKKQLYHGRKTAGAKRGEQKANRHTPLLEFAATRGKQRNMQILIAAQNADPPRLAVQVRRGGIGVLSPPRAEGSKDPSSDPKWELSMRSLRGKAEKGDRFHG